MTFRKFAPLQAQELERELDALKQEAAEKCRDMTIEEKRELGANLGKLPSEKLQRVVDIIIADSPVEEEVRLRPSFLKQVCNRWKRCQVAVPMVYRGRHLCGQSGRRGGASQMFDNHRMVTEGRDLPSGRLPWTSILRNVRSKRRCVYVSGE